MINQISCVTFFHNKRCDGIICFQKVIHVEDDRPFTLKYKVYLNFIKLNRINVCYIKYKMKCNVDVKHIYSYVF